MEGFAPTFAYYSDGYGGRLGQDIFDKLLPDAEARVDERTCHRRLSGLPDDEIAAYRRAICAACDALADPAASSYSAGNVSQTLVDADSRAVDRVIDRMLSQTGGLVLYGAWL